MGISFPRQPVTLFVTLAVVGMACTAPAPERRLSRPVLEDKVRGGWAGQMIGVAYGAPTEFQWNGRLVEGEIEWAPAVFVRPWNEWPVTQAGGAGSEAVLTFEGTGLAIIGGMTPAGGQADVYLDGEKSDLPFDAWIPERTFDNVPWHVTGLPPGEHTVRVVVTGDADERATGSVVQIQAAVVYGAGPTPRP